LRCRPTACRATSVYPIDIDRAFKKLDQIKRHIKVWWREGTQSQQLIRDGEVDMMSIWNARASELKQQGRARRGGLERRGAQHQHLGRPQGRTEPEACVGIDCVHDASQAAG